MKRREGIAVLSRLGLSRLGLSVLGLSAWACQQVLDLDRYSFDVDVAPDGGVGGGAGRSGGGNGGGLGALGGAGGASGSAGADGDAGTPDTPRAVFDAYSFQRIAAPPYVVQAGDGLLSNDTPGAELVAGSVVTERGGNVSIDAGGGFAYTPPTPAFWGDDHFTYEAAGTSARVRLSVQPGVIELSDIEAGAGNGFAINGVEIGDEAGTSVAAAGDVNGDGFADLIVGAEAAGPGVNAGAGNGTAYVVFGSDEPTAINLQSIEEGTGRGFAINGTIAYPTAGYSVSTAGDVNGDGLADLLLGAPSGSGITPSVGSAYVVFGKTSPAPIALADIENGEPLGFAIRGVTSGDSAGFSVSSAGDVNGDGLPDLLIGAPSASPSDDAAGTAYVVFGKATPAFVDLSTVENGSEGGFAIHGVGPGFNAGLSVAAAGDVNGDGRADVIVGSPSADPGGAGAAYVVFGKTTTAPVPLLSLESATPGGFAIRGAEVNDAAGTSVSGAGDLDGDGLDDVIVGVQTANPGGVNGAGTAYVVFGKRDTTAVSLLDLESGTGGGFVINGADEFDNAARAVAGGGDIDGDGRADLLVGATNAAALGFASTGRAYAVFGRAEPAAISLGSLDEAQNGGFAINGTSETSRVGGAVSLAGDVNRDGLTDLIVGVVRGNGGSTGKAYVLFGWDASQRLGARDTALVGGPASDLLTYTGLPLISVTGGNGTDTLRFEGGGLSLDLRRPGPHVDSIEIIDLTGAGDNTVILDDAAVRGLPQRRNDVIAGLAKTLIVLGDAGDRVELDLTGYTPAGTNAGRSVYRKNDAFYGIELSQDVALTP